MSNEGINRLARTLQSRVKEVNNTPPILDFGEIQGDMALLCNNFPKPIPQSDYMVGRSMCFDPAKPLTKTKETGEDVELPEKMYGIQPGDRVLVVWVGDDAMVIDVIKPATEKM